MEATVSILTTLMLHRRGKGLSVAIGQVPGCQGGSTQSFVERDPASERYGRTYEDYTPGSPVMGA